MTTLRRAAMIAGLAWLTCACVATGSLKRDLYPKSSLAPLSSAKVVLVRQPGPPASLLHKELPWSSAKIDLSGYPQAAADMLGSIYGQVSLADSADRTPAADFIVRLSTDYPKTIGLAFADPAGKPLASFSRLGMEIRDAPGADSVIAKIMTPPAMAVSFGTLGLVFAYRAVHARDQISLELSTTTAKALSELRAEIVAAAALVPAPAAAPWTSSPTCTAALSDAQAPPEIHLSCAQAAEAGRAWRQAAAHLKAYLAAKADAPDADKLRERIAELETRP